MMSASLDMGTARSVPRKLSSAFLFSVIRLHSIVLRACQKASDSASFLPKLNETHFDALASMRTCSICSRTTASLPENFRNSDGASVRSFSQ